MAAGAPGRFCLAQVGTLRPVQRVARRLRLASHIPRLGELGLAAVEGKCRGLAALALIALRAGRGKLRFGLMLMLLIAVLRTSLALPDLMGTLADISLARL